MKKDLIYMDFAPNFDWTPFFINLFNCQKTMTRRMKKSSINQVTQNNNFDI